MASDEKSCCAELKERYAKMEEKRNALRQAVKLLEHQIQKIESDKAKLKKECEEERTKAEFERQERLKESSHRITLENEISSLKSEISSLQLKGALATQDGDGVERESEINKLKKLLEEERIKAESERKKTEAEKSKAAEAWRILKAEKSKTDKERSIANSERKRADDHRLQLEKLKKEADEARSKAEEAVKKFEREKQKAAKEKQRADSEISKTEEQRKMTELNRKKAMDEKCRADCLSQQLKEDRQKIEKFQKEIDELVSYRRLAGAFAIPPDKNLNAETAKVKDQHWPGKINKEADDEELVLGFSKCEEGIKKIDAEKQKAIKEKKRADLEMAKAEEQRKLAEVNRKKVIQEKRHADQLAQQLEDSRQQIEELQKKINGHLPSGKLAEALSVPFDMKITTAKMELLKKQLKFEKKQVKHAKEVAQLEKDRNSILRQQIGHLKQDFVQFSHCLDALDNCFSHKFEVTDDMAKAENLSKMQQLSLMRRPSGAEPFQTLQSENRLVNHCCTAVNSSDIFKPTLDHTVPSFPISGGDCIEYISGIVSESESLLGGSDQKMLPNSAINSSMASFSDRQLMGSQEKGAFSVTTSTKLDEKNPTQTTISRFPTKMRYSKNFEVAAETGIRDSSTFNGIGRDARHSRKRKRILAAVESTEYLHSEDKKFDSDKPLEEGRGLVLNRQGDPNTKNGKSGKKPRVSHKKEADAKHSCHLDKRKKADKLGAEGKEKANSSAQASPPADYHNGTAHGHKDGACALVRSNQDAFMSFEEVVSGDYMKLLELDNAVDEASYQIAVERPLSPTLPEIEFHANQSYEVDDSDHLEESFNKLSNGKDSLVPSFSFDVINVEINSNQLKFHHSDVYETPMLQICDGLADSSENPENNENACCGPVDEGETCCNQILGSSAEQGMPKVTFSASKVGKFQSEGEIGALCDNIPQFCIVFSDTKDNSCISRIFCTLRACTARCQLASQSDWMVQEIIHALVMEDLPCKEKVCVLFSLLLHRLSGAALRVCQNILTRDSILCLDAFSAQINAVMSNAEMRSLFAKFCHVDELLTLIVEFLIDKKVLVYDNVPSESLPGFDSRISILLDGADGVLSLKTASAHQLVAGSIILASICTAVDHIGIVCEASYDIIRMHRFDCSLMLTILHVFAHICGNEYFTLNNYSLIMTVMKSLVTHSERKNFPIETSSYLSFWSEFPPCANCPFSQNASSVDAVISLLLEKLKDCTISGAVDQEPTESDKWMNSGSLLNKTAKDSSIEEVFCVHPMKCGMPYTSLKMFGMSAIQPGSDFNRSFCHLIDVLSLVELCSCSMTWEWTCNKVIPHLLEMLNLCILDEISAAIVILLGQLGRIGVDTGGYDDTGVEGLRSGLSAYFCKIITRKTCLPLHISTITALLGLLSIELKEFIHNDGDLPNVTSDSVIVQNIRNWFSSLSKEQLSLSVGLLESTSVHSYYS